MQRSVDTWLDEYGESHRHSTNKVLHWICVPVIVLTLIGLMWSIPVPSSFAAVSPWLNWGTLTMLAMLAYYLVLSLPLTLGMTLIFAVLAVIIAWLDTFTTPLWLICVALFVLAWIGQFIGHIYEGKRPSFFKDVQFLMIGPLWLLAHVYQRAGLKI